MLLARSMDTNEALNFGLLVDRVLQAIRRREHGGFREEDAESLEQAQDILDALVELRHEDSEVVFRQRTSRSSLSAYGTAINSLVSSTKKPPAEVFEKLESISDTVECLAADRDTEEADVEEVKSFFQFLSEATLSQGAEHQLTNAPDRISV